MVDKVAFRGGGGRVDLNRVGRWVGVWVCGRTDGRTYPYINGFSVFRAGEHDFRSSIPAGYDILSQVLRSFSFFLQSEAAG